MATPVRVSVASGRVTALLAVGLLSACSAGSTTPPTATAAPEPKVAALPPPGPGEPPPSPSKFVGMTANEVTATLGEPTFRRRDPPAEVWQYRSGSCVLDLFLYSDGRDKAIYAVTHAEARQRGQATRADAECVGRIVRERAPKPTS